MVSMRPSHCAASRAVSVRGGDKIMSQVTTLRVDLGRRQ